MDLNVVPLFVHKLPPDCGDILVTDRFLYVTDSKGEQLFVGSTQLSECRLDGDSVSENIILFRIMSKFL